MTTDLTRLLNKARSVMNNAYKPYSNFAVGACIKSTNGHEYIGTNVENVAYGTTLCAESGAVSSMVANGDLKIADIVIISSSEQIITPCGNCRQLLAEFSDSNTKIHLCDQKGIKNTLSIDELLPGHFNSSFLEESS